ncbi:MAG: sodium:solute symporter [Opitutales bacterium]
MSLIDYVVLFGTLLSIAGYGMWQTRRDRGLRNYLKGDDSIRWGTIGLSVMATQASAITFLSTPGQGFASGMGFVQNYFGLPFAIIVVCAVFLPIYRRLRVYTAYEYLGQRFDLKTQMLGAGLFLVQRGLAAGITIYAPAIIPSTLLGWSLDMTVVATGVVVILYTVSGGTKAVSITQRYQMGVILVGMVVAFGYILHGLPEGVSLGDAVSLAGATGKLEIVDFSFDFEQRYTFWSGLLGGFFLALSYFGTDQSQVQRYLAGTSTLSSRLGLLFNAVVKIPMQFFILFVGVLVFVFYQFEKPPLFFNQPAWETALASERGPELAELEREHAVLFDEKAGALAALEAARGSGQNGLVAENRAIVLALEDADRDLRERAKGLLLELDPNADVKDSDYVFITFVLTYLPHGVIGLLIAVIIAAAMSSTASELNALGSTTTVDIYRKLINPDDSDEHTVKMSRWFTAGWGGLAILFALFASLVENLIEAVNIVGSLFYGVILGIFLVAFFLKHVRGSAVFAAAILSQGLNLFLFYRVDLGYLWLNPTGVFSVVVLALVFQALFGRDQKGVGGVGE